MNPYPNPLIRIIIDDEDGELPSIDISHHLDYDDHDDDEEAEEDEEERHRRHQDEAGEYEESVSETSSVDSFIRQLDSLHPYRLFVPQFSSLESPLICFATQE